MQSENFGKYNSIYFIVMNRKIDIRNGDHSVSKPTLGIQIKFNKKSEKKTFTRIFNRFAN